MPDKYLIYGLVDPLSGQLRYLGKSESGLRRPRRHRRPCELKIDNSHKGRWIKKLHAKNLSYGIVVIQETDKATLVQAEIFWIAYFRAMGCPLTNLTDGGDGVSGYKHSELAKAAIGFANKGRLRTPPQIAKMVAARNNREIGVTQKIKASKALGGRPIVCLETGKSYHTQGQASQEMGIRQSSISQALKTGYRAGGYRFAYANSEASI